MFGVYDDLSYKVDEAISLIEECGGHDGGHHKQWVLDQVVRILLSNLENKDCTIAYDKWKANVIKNNLCWDEGIAP